MVGEQMSERQYAVRVSPRRGEENWAHPEFVGPLPYNEASVLAERIWRMTGRSYEIGQLVLLDDLPGLMQDIGLRAKDD